MEVKNENEALDIVSKLPFGVVNYSVSPKSMAHFREAVRLYNSQYRKIHSGAPIPILFSDDMKTGSIRNIKIAVKPHERFEVRNPGINEMSVLKRAIKDLLPGNSLSLANLTPAQIASIRVFCSKHEKGGFSVATNTKEATVYRNISTKENFSQELVARLMKTKADELVEIPHEKEAYARVIVSKAFRNTGARFQFVHLDGHLYIRRRPTNMVDM